MIELVIILIYFAFVLGVGIYSSFKIKKPDDYYVAGKKAGFIQVSGSLLATILGGSAILGTIELSQKIGWAALWFLFSAALGLFVLIPISKHVKRLGNFTLPELLGKFYGKKAETIASIIIPIAWLGIVAAQIIAAAKIVSGIGFINYTNAALISGAIFIAYTLLGGQLSILKTDTLQAVLIITGLIALIFFTVNSKETVQIQHLKFSSLFNSSFSVFDLLILVLTYSVTFVVGPDIYSRVFCAKNEKTASRSILMVAILLIPISFGLTYLGVFSAQTGSTGLVSFAQNLLPNWVFGLFIAALLSTVMSSADTTLLTSSMILSGLFTGNIDNKDSLQKTKLIIVIIGICSIIIALFVTSIIQSLLLALAFFSGAFVIPTLAGLLQIEVNKKSVVSAVIVGGIVALSGKIISLFLHELTGNIIIVSAYFFNVIIMFYRKATRQSG